MQPNYQLNISNNDITDLLKNRLVSLSLCEKNGLYADKLSIVISDHDGKIQLPKRGIRISCALGWQQQPLIDKGSYVVDTIEHSGPPDHLTINAYSADFYQSFIIAKERSWHQTTLGNIVKTIAEEQHLSASISNHLSQIEIQHIDQTNESDANLLTRLSQRYNAISTIKHNKLLMLSISSGKTQSGNTIPIKKITRQQTNQHQLYISDRQTNYTGVKAYWDDKSTGKQLEIIYGNKQHCYTLRQHFANQNEAYLAAQAQWQHLQQKQYQMTITLAYGHADIMVGSRIKLHGWKTSIDALTWLVTETQHSINENGFTSHISLQAGEGLK